MKNEQVFQILLLEIKEDNHDGIEPVESILALGTKAELRQKFGIDEKELDLPSKGAEVCSDFLNVCDSNDSEKAINLSMYNPIRFMLQCRILSQLLAKTWLWEESKKNELEHQILFCIKEILSRKFNESPDSFWVSNQENPNDMLNQKDMIEHLQKYIKDPKKRDFSLVLDPFSNPIAYKTIQLALLLAGQAYLKIKIKDENKDNCQDKRDNFKWVSVLKEPILSTYEIVMEYSFNMDFDSYAASRVELVRGTEPPSPPYYQVAIPYPAKPTSESLSEYQIKLWAEAPLWAKRPLKELTDEQKELWDEEKGSWVDGKPPLWAVIEKDKDKVNVKNKIPFYPDPEDDITDYTNKKLRYVVPPFTYLPLSTS